MAAFINCPLFALAAPQKPAPFPQPGHARRAILAIFALSRRSFGYPMNAVQAGAFVMLKEFREFAIKGNVVDMGVGIVIGAAFTSIVTSFVEDIINPIIGLFTGGIDFSNLFLNLSGQEFTSVAAARAAGAATLNYGLFLNALVSFLIVAWVLFFLIKGVNRLKAQMALQEAAAPAPDPAPSPEAQLLREIRDLMAARQGGA
jgi:large conductance mechanosensitive channel